MHITCLLVLLLIPTKYYQIISISMGVMACTRFRLQGRELYNEKRWELSLLHVTRLLVLLFIYTKDFVADRKMPEEKTICLPNLKGGDIINIESNNWYQRSKYSQILDCKQAYISFVCTGCHFGCVKRQLEIAWGYSLLAAKNSRRWMESLLLFASNHKRCR